MKRLTIKQAICEVLRRTVYLKKDTLANRTGVLLRENNVYRYDSNIFRGIHSLCREGVIKIDSDDDYSLNDRSMNAYPYPKDCTPEKSDPPEPVVETQAIQETLIEMTDTLTPMQFVSYTIGQIFFDPEYPEDVLWELYDTDLIRERHLIAFVDRETEQHMVLDIVNRVNDYVTMMLDEDTYHSERDQVTHELRKGHGVSIRGYLPMEGSRIVPVRSTHQKKLSEKLVSDGLLYDWRA